MLHHGSDHCYMKVRTTLLERFKEVGEMMFHVVLQCAEDGWVVAECPALPGCVSQGKDEKDALENIKEAINAWLWAEDQKAIKDYSDRPEFRPLVVAV
jgi:predicted RNase H-like HicB family nuclease